MAFTVEQRGGCSVFGCVGSEQDPSKKSFTTNQPWVSEKSTPNKDVTAQVSDRLVLSAASEPSIKLADSPPFSHGITFEQVSQNTYPGRGVASGEGTPGVAPCTPCPSFLQQKSQGQTATKLSHASPSLCLGIDHSEGHQVQCIQRPVDTEILNSPSECLHYLHQLSTNSLRSRFITPSHGCEFQLDAQKEVLEPYREDMMSSLPCTHERHRQECAGPHPVLSLGHFTETSGLQKSTAQYTQDTDFAHYIRGEYDSRLPLLEADGCSQHYSECLNNVEPGPVNSRYLSHQSKFVVPNYRTLEIALDCSSPQKTNPGAFVARMEALANLQASSSCYANAASVSCSPPMKQDWRETLTQLTHCNPALSVQQNVGVSVRPERECPERRSKLLLSQRSLAFGGSDEWNEFNVSSSGLPYRDEAGQNAQTFEQHNAAEALEEASGLKTNWCGRPLENSFRPVNLAKVKVEIGYEESNGRQYTCRGGVEENDMCETKPQPEVGFLDGCPATHAMRVEMPQVLSTVSAEVPSICNLNELLQKPMDLEEQTTPMSRTSIIDGGWGKFLALSATAVGDTGKANTEIILPFQHRFKQLQEFLTQCDTSDKYSLQAFQSLSAAAWSCHAVDLETRAVRLSWEEGKELKRMKLLNVLGKASEGPDISSSGVFYGPRLPAPGAFVQVKQES